MLQASNRVRYIWKHIEVFEKLKILQISVCLLSLNAKLKLTKFPTDQVLCIFYAVRSFDVPTQRRNYFCKLLYFRIGNRKLNFGGNFDAPHALTPTANTLDLNTQEQITETVFEQRGSVILLISGKSVCPNLASRPVATV